MDHRMYERTTAGQFEGHKVKSVVDLKNGVAIYPAGTVYEIKRKYAGFELWSEPCPTCKSRQIITRVPPSKVELLE